MCLTKIVAYVYIATHVLRLWYIRTFFRASGYSLSEKRYNSPSSKLTKTSWPANVLLLVRHKIVPKIHGMPWPVSASSLTIERTLPHDDVLYAHTPSRLDIQISMARREFIAMPLNEGFSCMQSSSGNSFFSLLFSGVSCCAFSPGWCWLCCCLCNGLRAVPRASALPLFKGWFRDINSGLFSTLFRSLALDRDWFTGILILYWSSSFKYVLLSCSSHWETVIGLPCPFPDHVLLCSKCCDFYSSYTINRHSSRLDIWDASTCCLITAENQDKQMTLN